MSGRRSDRARRLMLEMDMAEFNDARRRLEHAAGHAAFALADFTATVELALDDNPYLLADPDA